jgi:hypothetical protein
MIADNCPFCGRPMSRSPQARLEDPFCPTCIPERIKAAGARTYIKPELRLDADGYARVVEHVE